MFKHFLVTSSTIEIVENLIQKNKMETFGTPTRRAFTISKKLEVIEAYESRFNSSLTHKAAYFDIDKSILHRWLKNKEKLSKTPRSVKKISINRGIGAYPELEIK